MNAVNPPAGYPLRIERTLDRDLSRGLCLIKWLLAIPQYLIVAVFLDTGWTAWGAHEGWEPSRSVG